MKRILIFSHAMELGGAEKALLGLLEAFDTSKYKVDLFLMRHSGELFQFIPEKINILPEIPQYASLAVPIQEILKKRQYGVAFGRFRGKHKARSRIRKIGLAGDNDVNLQYSHLYTLPFMPMISTEEYDAAISFLTPHYFVTERVNAKKKIAWIHTDYRTISIDQGEQLRMWSKYDHIISISQAVTDSFCEKFPGLREKIFEIGNLMPVDYLKKMVGAFSAEEEMPDDGSVRLLSIGRFSYAKNFDNIPDICRRIRINGLNIKWYLIGYGGDEALIHSKITETKMQDYVIILGKKDNPYPYIKACDLYVQPSRYEGKCVSVIEAQILHKPVVITKYATSASQLEDGIDGIIVPLDNRDCADEITSIIQDKKMLQGIIDNTRGKDYTNRNQYAKLEYLFE